MLATIATSTKDLQHLTYFNAIASAAAMF